MFIWKHGHGISLLRQLGGSWWPKICCSYGYPSYCWRSQTKIQVHIFPLFVIFSFFRLNYFMSFLSHWLIDFKTIFFSIYRCAQYSEDEYTGEIKFALSSDSTCTNHLRSPTEGYETMALRPTAQGPWPSHLTESCELPEWVQGQWEYIHVQGGTVLLKDNRNFKTYTARCIKSRNEEKFLMYARSHCGEEHYKCVWFKNRGINAIEFQVGKSTATFFSIQHFLSSYRN